MRNLVALAVAATVIYFATGGDDPIGDLSRLMDNLSTK